MISLPCVHRGTMQTRDCGCKGTTRATSDDVYRCWLGGNQQSCIIAAEKLSRPAAEAAGLRVCSACHDRVEPLVVHGAPVAESPLAPATSRKRGITWDEARRAFETRTNRNAVPWTGWTNANATTPTTKASAQIEIAAPVLGPEVIWRCDMSQCVPHFHQFNCSTLLWRGKRLLVYRHRRQGSELRLCFLDGDNVAFGDRKIETARTPWNELSDEDPKFFTWQGQPCVSFNGVARHGNSLSTHMMFVVLDPDTLQTRAQVVIDYPERRAWEKNWTFFEHDGRLLCVYDIHPHHRILEITGHEAKLLAETPAPSDMVDWIGSPRGGAAPVLIDGEYWSFCHGTRILGTTRKYTIGLYCFEARAPFRMTRAIPGPILLADEADRWGSEVDHASVVFPGGVTIHGGLAMVSYGYMDRWCELAVYSIDALRARLVDVVAVAAAASNALDP